ncbi:uncharacterized protein LOC143212372 [Lasioglossum baleicum]|uniref:uncharacterized protein LOC143212372 n=1 Tax=Lasioglossum baleicum TaxID=434251 RepID=UPI003FCDBA89
MKIKIKKAVDIAMENKDTTTNVSIYENLSLSKTTQQHKLTNGNAINRINQLLNLYHPEDGIAVYEQILSTLLFLSENFDSKTRQQIISTVPLPKGASNELIKDVIYKTTGFIEITNDVRMFQKSNTVSTNTLNIEDATDKSRVRLNQNILMSSPSQNIELDENIVPSVPEVFRGFPPNEISMIHSHVRNVNYVYDTLDYNIPCIEPFVDIRQNFLSHTDQQEDLMKRQANLKLKWIHTPQLLYKKDAYQITTTSYQEDFYSSLSDKCFQLPVDKADGHNKWNVAKVSHTLHQAQNDLKKKCNANIISNTQNKAEILEVPNSSSSFLNSGINCCEFLRNDDQDLKNYNNGMNENRILNTNTCKPFKPKFKTNQQAILDDIYKMDVVCWNEEVDTTVSTENSSILDDFIINKKLETSLDSFLKRAEHEAKCWKFVTRKNPENKNQFNSPMSNANNSRNVNSSENIKKLIDKKYSRLSNTYPKSIQLQVPQKNVNTPFNDLQSMEYVKKDNSVENLPYKSAVNKTEQNMNILQKSTPITEFATFKKHYYDTLLNIQKAKVAVANSLAISSVESSTKYEPYYSSCSYQQQQLLQQHGQLTVNPQFAVHTVAQSGLSNIHSTPYTWVRYNDWRHPTMKQLRFPQQSPFQHSKNKE